MLIRGFEVMLNVKAGGFWILFIISSWNYLKIQKKWKLTKLNTMIILYVEVGLLVRFGHFFSGREVTRLLFSKAIGISGNKLYRKVDRSTLFSVKEVSTPYKELALNTRFWNMPLLSKVAPSTLLKDRLFIYPTEHTNIR